MIIDLCYSSHFCNPTPDAKLIRISLFSKKKSEKYRSSAENYFEIEVHSYKTYFGQNISLSLKSAIIGTPHNEEKTGSELCYGISATKFRISVPNITDSFYRSVKHAMFWVT